MYPGIRIRAAYHNNVPGVEHERLQWVRLDLRRAEECDLAVQGCAMAVLCAAVSVGSAGLRATPWVSVTDNLVMNAALLEAMHRHKVRRAVFTGSATVYQAFQGTISEDQLDLNTELPPAYLGVGWVMRYLEKLCLFCSRTGGIRFSVIRAANIYGPWSRFAPNSSTFVQALVHKAVSKADPFEVWGDPEVKRDIIYYKDFGQAVALLLAKDDHDFEVFNIGSGRTVTVDEVVRLALKAAGHAPSRVEYLASGPATIDVRVLDCSKVRERLGWSASTPPEQGIAETTHWWRENQSRWKK